LLEGGLLIQLMSPFVISFGGWIAQLVSCNRSQTVHLKVLVSEAKTLPNEFRSDASNRNRRKFKMRKAMGGLVLLAMVLAVAAITVRAADSAMSWTGWISDSSCGAKGANAGHKACAIDCVKNKGQSWVFVDDKTKKVIAIDNQDIVNPDNDLGMEVTLTGTVTQSGALHVDKITPAATM